MTLLEQFKTDHPWWEEYEEREERRTALKARADAWHSEAYLDGDTFATDAEREARREWVEAMEDSLRAASDAYWEAVERIGWTGGEDS